MDTEARVDARSYNLHVKHYEECDNKLAALGRVPMSMYSMKLALHDIYIYIYIYIYIRSRS